MDGRCGYVTHVTLLHQRGQGELESRQRCRRRRSARLAAPVCSAVGGDTPLVDAVRQARRHTQAAFFCPGHKMGAGAPIHSLMGADVWNVDLPELPGLDNLFAPEGVIQEAEDRAARVFGAERTFFLVNGSTCGVIASVVAAVTPQRNKVVLPRNVHQSAVQALIISGAEPIFVQPHYDPDDDVLHGVVVETIIDALEAAERDSVAAVLVISPTYHGVTSDVLRLSDAAHRHGAALIVDEAHGAHCGLHPSLPISAMSQGADVAIQSTHKTLSSLTQSAMLHIGPGSKIRQSDVQSALQLVQSTSPSYLLLTSLDAARHQIECEGRDIYARVVTLADQARK